MSPSWKLEPLQEFIRQSRRSEAQHLFAMLRSVMRSNDVFQYHRPLARDAMKGMLDTDAPAGRHNVSLVMGGNERELEFARASIASEANTIGCMHSARNVFDQFAQLANALLLAPAIPIGQCTVAELTKRLSQSPLKAELQSLIALPAWSYVCDFVNVTKHRLLVSHGLSISFEDDSAAMRVGAFEYGDRQHAARDVRDALQQALDVNNRLVQCGRALNVACSLPP